LPGELIGGWVGGTIGDMPGRALQWAANTGRQMHTLNFGGGYEDSQIAWTMRQRASMELNSSLLSMLASGWVGKP
jgi:hypothetical protein